MRVLMLVINPMVSDARVDKEAASLAAVGADVTVLATAAGDLPPDERRHGFTIVRLPYQRVVKDRVTGTISDLRTRDTATGKLLARIAWGFGGGFLKVARSLLLPTEYYQGLAQHALDLVDTPDIIHAHDLGTLRAASKLSTRWARTSGTRPKVVYDSHELYVEQQTRWKWWEKLAWRAHERRWIRHADAVITVSGGIAEELQRRYHLAIRPTVVLNSPRIDPPGRLGRTVRDDLDLESETPLAVYAGAVKPSRGVEVLANALTDLPEWHIALVGSTPDQLRLVLDASESGQAVAPRIHALAPVPSWALTEYLSTANVGVHPLPDTCLNHRLALPNKLFDYAFAGLPIVANDLPEMARLITERRLGTVCDTADAPSIAAALRDSGQLEPIDPDTIEDLSWERQEDALIATYERILSNERRSGI